MPVLLLARRACLIARQFGAPLRGRLWLIALLLGACLGRIAGRPFGGCAWALVAWHEMRAKRPPMAAGAAGGLLPTW